MSELKLGICAECPVILTGLAEAQKLKLYIDEASKYAVRDDVDDEKAAEVAGMMLAKTPMSDDELEEFTLKTNEEEAIVVLRMTAAVYIEKLTQKVAQIEEVVNGVLASCPGPFELNAYDRRDPENEALVTVGLCSSPSASDTAIVSAMLNRRPLQDEQ